MGDSSIQLRNSTPTTDIYGSKLVERLTDIYSCIHCGAEEMESVMCGLPKTPTEGHLVIEVLMASILANTVEKGIVIQSLLIGNSAFNSVGLTHISERMTRFLQSYQKYHLRNHIKERLPLIDFIKAKGNLVLKVLNEPDKSGNIKIPVFVKNGVETVRCRFAFFEKEEQTPDYIRTNLKSIVVERVEEEDYYLIQQRDIDWWLYLSAEIIAYDIYHSSFARTGFFADEEYWHKGNSEIIPGYGETTDFCPQIVCALQEGVRSMEVVACSLGIIGQYEKHESVEDDFPF